MGTVTRRASFLRRRLRQRLRLPGRKPSDADGSLSLDADGDSRTLLVAFGGLMGERIGEPAFEFSMATRQMPVKRLFVRDLRQAWYHRGMPEYGTTLASVADGLGELVAEHEVDRLVMAGNSAGGYAALVFGTLLRADTVLSFAPQTVLDLPTLATMGDHRWDDQLQGIAAANALDPSWTDLRQALPASARGGTSYRIFFDDSLAVDRLHAERLRGLPGVRLYRFGAGAHGLVRELRGAGALEHLLRDALEAPGAHGPAPS
jgi:hypothetical protein